MGEDTTGGQYGPSWWDCEHAVQGLQGEFDCSVLVETTYAVDKASGRGAWWVRAAAHPQRSLDKPARAYGGAAFRGNAGAKTYTAALWLALVRLREQLEEKAQVAKQASMF